MKNKILIALTVLMNVISPAYSFQIQISDEIKAFGIMFVKISLGVIISSFAIAIGLWIFSLFKKKQEVLPPEPKYTCEIDDTTTIDEAIKTFLTINS